MTNRPVLIGENSPGESYTVLRMSPLYPYPPGCAGFRLWKFSGLRRVDYLETFDRMNLLPSPMWDTRVAVRAAVTLWRGGILRDRDVILLGQKVKRAFESMAEFPKELEMLTWCQAPDRFCRRVVCLPHPSGRNLQWNDRCVVQRATAILSQAHQAYAHPIRNDRA